MRRSWSAWLLGMLLLASCSDGGGENNGPDDGGNTNPPATRAGMGPSTARPMGTAYTLPAGLQLKEPIDGFDKFECYRDEQKDRPERGDGGLVRLCLQFTNTTQQPITVRFPEGLIFISLSDETQNGLLLKLETFEVPPGPYSVDLLLACLNANRDVTAPGDDYTLGPVTTDPDVKELLDLVKDKELTADTSPIVQNALWNITDHEGLTPQDRANLNGL